MPPTHSYEWEKEKKIIQVAPLSSSTLYLSLSHPICAFAKQAVVHVFKWSNSLETLLPHGQTLYFQEYLTTNKNTMHANV